MTFIRKTGYSIIILIAFSTWACNNEPELCEIPEQGFDYVLSDAVKAYFSNYEEAGTLIFLDESGNEKAFTISGTTSSTASYGFSKVCEADNTLFQYVEGTSQIAKLYINHEELSKLLYLQLVKYPETEDVASFEAVEVFYGELYDLAEGDGLFSYATNGENPYATTHDSLELNNRVYYNVIDIVDPNNVPKLDIKYTKNEGIIYIKNNENSLEYFYDRKE